MGIVALTQGRLQDHKADVQSHETYRDTLSPGVRSEWIHDAIHLVCVEGFYITRFGTYELANT